MLTMLGLSLTTKLPIIFGSDGEINVNSQFVNSTIPSVLLNMTLTPDSHPSELANAQKLHHIYGVLSALTSTLFASSVFIFIRKAKGIHIFILSFYTIFNEFSLLFLIGVDIQAPTTRLLCLTSVGLRSLRPL